MEIGEGMDGRGWNRNSRWCWKVEVSCVFFMLMN